MLNVIITFIILILIIVLVYILLQKLTGKDTSSSSNNSEEINQNYSRNSNNNNSNRNIQNAPSNPPGNNSSHAINTNVTTQISTTNNNSNNNNSNRRDVEAKPLTKKEQVKMEKKKMKDDNREYQKMLLEEKKLKEEMREKEYLEKEQRRDEELRKEEEILQKLKEDKEKRENEIYDKWKDQFKVAEEGEEVSDLNNEDLINDFLTYIKIRKVVSLEDLSGVFKISPNDIVERLNYLETQGRITGIVDDRGKYIYLAEKELSAIEKIFMQRGRISKAELIKECNKIIRFVPLEEDKQKISEEQNKAWMNFEAEVEKNNNNTEKK